jgi:hypothetical protein
MCAGAPGSTLLFNLAAHGDTNPRSQLANPVVTELPQAAPRFDQALFANYCDVLRASRGIRLKARFARCQKDMCWSVFMNACRQRRHKHRIGSRVTVSYVQRNDHNRPLSFAGRIGVELNEPDLTAARSSDWSWHSEGLCWELAQSELAPIALLLFFTWRE